MPLMPIPPMPTKCICSFLSPIHVSSLSHAQQAVAFIDDTGSGIRSAQCSCFLFQLLQDPLVMIEGKDLLRQPFPGEFLLRDHPSRAALYDEFRIFSLMVVGGVGIGYQEGGPAPGAELRYRSSAGPADRQMGLVITGGHVIDKRIYRGLEAVLLISLFYPCCVLCTGLVDDPQLFFYRRAGQGRASLMPLLMAVAPWLPPRMRRVNSFPSRFFPLPRRTSRRRGLPVTRVFSAGKNCAPVCPREKDHAGQNRAAILLVKPG